MKNTIKTLLVALLVLSTESKSMEISMDLAPEQCQCICDRYPTFKEPVEERNHYLLLFEADNRENNRTCFQIDLKMDTPNELMLKLSETFYVMLCSPIAHVYLKISEMALKSIANITNGTLPEGIKIVKSNYDGEPEFRNSEGRHIGDVDKGLNFCQIKTLHDGISVVAFDEKLPAGLLLSSQSMGKGSIRMASSHRFIQEDM